MGLNEALQALWPVLTTLGGGYMALLYYIRKIMEERLKDKDFQIAKLEKERDQFRDLALRSINATERIVEQAKPQS